MGPLQNQMAGMMGLQQGNPYLDAQMYRLMAEEQMRAQNYPAAVEHVNRREPDNPVLLLIDT